MNAHPIQFTFRFWVIACIRPTADGDGVARVSLGDRQ